MLAEGDILGAVDRQPCAAGRIEQRIGPVAPAADQAGALSTEVRDRSATMRAGGGG